jgi:ABC-type bacteriocin/lantibiotic exporter with double-glycine peptidase domain
MQNIHLLQRSFVRQAGEDDCGLACLSMILAYGGKLSEQADLSRQLVPPGGLSLLDLKHLAVRYGLNARVVELDVPTLRSLPVPCILHTHQTNGAPHFEVCYGSRLKQGRYRYLMADPAGQFYWLAEPELLSKWPFRAALHFAELTYDPAAFRHPSWQVLLSLRPFPLALLLPVPLLSIGSALTGVAVSWTLQRGINDPSILQGRVVVLLLGLLLLIGVARSGMAFLRQYLLVRLDTGLHQHLMHRLIVHLFRPETANTGRPDPALVSTMLADVQKVRTAMISMLSVLFSDGLMIAGILGAVFCYLPLAGVSNVLYLGVCGWLFARRFITLRQSVSTSSQEAGSLEHGLIQDVERLPALAMARLLKQQRQLHLDRQSSWLIGRLSMLTASGKVLLGLELLGVVNIILVWIIGLYRWQQLTVSYSVLMTVVILSYFLSTLITRIASALLVISDGADAARQLQRVLSPEK